MEPVSEDSGSWLECITRLFRRRASNWKVCIRSIQRNKTYAYNFGCFYYFNVLLCGEFFSLHSLLLNTKAMKTKFFANASESVYLLLMHSSK